MSGIALSKYITDWDSQVTGDGVYVVNGSNLSVWCASGAGTGRAYAKKYVPVTGGETVRFTFMARRISGVPYGSIDYPFLSNGALDQVEIVGDDWREYEITIAVPYFHNDATRYVTCTAGVINAEAGSVEVADLRIDVSDGSRSPLNCIASGLFTISRVGGTITPSLNANFHYCGITNLSLVGDTLTVTIPNTAPLPSSHMRPIFFAQLTTENLHGWSLHVGAYDASAGTVKILFVNPAGTAADPNTGMGTSASMFMNFMAVGI